MTRVLVGAKRNIKNVTGGNDMISTCPSCLAQVSHEDHSFEVICECGVHFTPSITQEDMPSLDDGLDRREFISGFNESESAFEEIRQYGEGIADGKDPIMAKPQMANIEKISKPKDNISVFPNSLPSSCLMTSGDSLNGFQIEGYFQPVSVMGVVDNHDDPLKPTLDHLWTKVSESGANALIHLKWRVSTDLTKVLASGIPVKCSKN